MKINIIKKVFILVLLFSISVNSQEKSNWNFTKYAEVLDTKGKSLFILEYGVSKKGYTGSIKWRITNNTSKTIKDITLGKRIYNLKDGKKVEQSAESPFLKIESNEKKSLISDAINTSESKGWDNLNDNYVIKIEFPQKILSFPIEKDGKKIDWSEFGKLKTYQIGN